MANALDDWVDPTGRLTRRDLSYLHGAFEKVSEATELPAFNWEAQMFAGLLTTDGELAPDFPAREAVGNGWAFLVHQESSLALDEQLTPGITEYVAHLMGRAAVLGRQTADMFLAQYRGPWCFISATRRLLRSRVWSWKSSAASAPSSGPTHSRSG